MDTAQKIIARAKLLQAQTAGAGPTQIAAAIESFRADVEKIAAAQ